ncbi:hypothetical protein L596_027332 [Steinernema carpocapsae]|uniref:Uncharacterized protein n=1 Tax=Steinernema carpocapsae TaxID=34508 RepID=A0A4U5M404_STECR|nr:hypothetical protein L596_027332 [Steinernema carpocapsae]
MDEEKMTEAFSEEQLQNETEMLVYMHLSEHYPEKVKKVFSKHRCEEFEQMRGTTELPKLSEVVEVFQTTRLSQKRKPEDGEDGGSESSSDQEPSAKKVKKTESSSDSDSDDEPAPKKAAATPKAAAKAPVKTPAKKADLLQTPTRTMSPLPRRLR